MTLSVDIQRETSAGCLVPSLEGFAAHSPYSDPGALAERLRELPDDVDEISRAARGVIAHYRAELPDLSMDRRDEVNLRWLSRILSLDARRHPQGLGRARSLQQRVAGCCRDHSLFVIGALREHGVPARSRVGFANYLSPGYHHDHVIVEHHDGTRWVATDPELTGEDWSFDLRDMAIHEEGPFISAAQAWQGYRQGRLDPRTFGVFPGSAFCSPDFVRAYVVFEVAHRYGDELLLWDVWGYAGDDAEASRAEAVVDEVAALLIRSDAGDEGAESELLDRYREDNMLRPGRWVTQRSPYGADDVRVDLKCPR